MFYYYYSYTLYNLHYATYIIQLTKAVQNNAHKNSKTFQIWFHHKNLLERVYIRIFTWSLFCDMASSSVVVYDIFDRCIKYTPDPFWKKILENCSHSHFPRGVRYIRNSDTEGVLISHSFSIKYKKNTTGNTTIESVSLPLDEEKLCHETINTIKTKLGEYSDLDLKIQDEEFNSIANDLGNSLTGPWKTIKPRHVKEYMYRNYICSLTSETTMNADEIRKLLISLHLALQFKIITNDNIKFENGKIISITGIEKTDDGHYVIRIFDQNKFKQRTTKTEKTRRKTSIEQHIARFLVSNSKRYVSMTTARKTDE